MPLCRVIFHLNGYLGCLTLDSDDRSGFNAKQVRCNKCTIVDFWIERALTFRLGLFAAALVLSDVGMT